MTKWRYGDSWEKHPVEEGEVWGHKESGSLIAVHDLRNPLPEFMSLAEMVYCDPPWSKGNLNSFITKAGMDSYENDFNPFMDILFARIKEIDPRVCYLEIGEQHLADFQGRMFNCFPAMQWWPITYYKRNRCYLVRGGKAASPDDFSGLDDEDAPYAAIEAERPESVADICTGRGLTMLAAHKHGITFYGTELNKRRLAVAIDRAAKIGVHYEKHNL